MIPDGVFRKSRDSNPSGNCVEVAWQKACNGGACVEVSKPGAEVLVRDSKNPNGPVQEYTTAEWQAFIDGVKAGQFDLA